MLVCAERYALGRRTYIVQWTCEFIKNNLHLLTEKDIQVMIRDIENSIDYGDECDKAEWLNLLEILREEEYQAIENILADRERLEKSQKEMIEKLVKDDRFDKANKYDSLVEELKNIIKDEKKEFLHFDKIEDKEKTRMHAYARKVLQELLDTVEEEKQ